MGELVRKAEFLSGRLENPQSLRHDLMADAIPFYHRYFVGGHPDDSISRFPRSMWDVEVSDMKATLLSVFLASGILGIALPAAAHHSFAAEFDITKPVSLKGTLTKMAWVNPHGWIYMDVKTPDGKVENWAVEAGGPTALLRRGLRAADFPVGLQIVVDGYRSKDGSPRANGQKVTFADGRNFFLGPDDASLPAPATKQ